MSAALRLLVLCATAVLAAAAPAAAADPNPWREARTWNIAHQGGEDEFPSNTLYAFKQALRAGADMLELDVGVTRDDQVVVMHDTTLDRTTNGTGTIASHTLRQIRRLDGASWFSRHGEHYGHDKRRSAYVFRGIATGQRRPPRGFRRSDFRVPTLRQVLRAFPRTPINVEIKGRTKAEGVESTCRTRACSRACSTASRAATSSSCRSSSPRSICSTSSRRPSRWRRASTAPRRSCSAAARRARGSWPSSCRSPTSSTGRSST
ncbi:MAG: glycerophosphodiester phosphodiesterase family protein [Solirubrobacterales bacterium]